MTKPNPPSSEDLWRPKTPYHLPPIEHERRRNWASTRSMEEEIYRSTTRDIAHNGEWWDERMAKPLGCLDNSGPLTDPTGEFGDCEPPDEEEKQVRIAELADSIESTGTASANPED